jgi:hypothetical protein
VPQEVVVVVVQESHATTSTPSTLMLWCVQTWVDESVSRTFDLGGHDHGQLEGVRVGLGAVRDRLGEHEVGQCPAHDLRCRQAVAQFHQVCGERLVALALHALGCAGPR